MPVSWADIAFQPGPNLALEIQQAWAWLLGGRPFAPFMCSRLGDVFYETDGGAIEWLRCSDGSISVAASSRQEFDRLCSEGAPDIDIWFGPGLVERLHAAGKRAEPDQCYAFVILPIFKECRFEADNLNPVPAREVLVGMADILRQLHDLPDGSAVQMKMVD